ncbi:hypothetical protein [Salinisphaera sp. LB1]|uniref:hypothetical protein n=1 Tax=Salinisphaera sp. LB1 TaxID=2183911 RepID=UPI0011AB32B8|nr:hypothetical protein [Salinisphaera sp. LB1]
MAATDRPPIKFDWPPAWLTDTPTDAFIVENRTGTQPERPGPRSTIVARAINPQILLQIGGFCTRHEAPTSL